MNVEDGYTALWAASRYDVLANDIELEHLTEGVNRLVTKGIKEEWLKPEEEKLLALLTDLIEDYEQQHEPLGDVVTGPA